MEMKDVARALSVELGEEFKIYGGLSFKYKLEKDGLIFWSEDLQEWISSNFIGDLLAGKAKIVKLPYQTLTDSEKKYLLNVIEPFRDRVMYIIKREIGPDEYITICVKHYNGRLSGFDFVKLLGFEKETMYKGLKIKKRYTLKELDL